MPEKYHKPEKQQTQMRKAIAIKFLFICAFMAGCTASGNIENENKEVQLLPVTQLITRDTIIHQEYVGDIHAIQNVEIRARVQGYLEKVYVDEGREVKKGQLLFRINEAEYQAEFAKTEANLKNAIAEAKAAELEMKRVKLLVEKKVVSNTDLELAHARLDAAKAGIEEAESARSNAAIRLENTNIRAPFNGIIDRIPFKAGSLIDEGTHLTTVSNLSEVYTYFNVSENEYLNYIKNELDTAEEDQNNIVELILADGTKYKYKGKIETMEGEFETSTGTIAFRARFPNPDMILKHRSTGKIRLADEVDDALFVPQKSTFEIQDKNFVFVVDAKNKVKMRSFVPKKRLDDFYIVESGLEEGETVVYEGVQNLREGLKIEPSLFSMDSLISGDI